MMLSLTQRVSPFLMLITWPTPAQPSKLGVEATSLEKLLWLCLFSPLSVPSVSIASTVLSTLNTTHHSDHMIVGVLGPSIQKQISGVRLLQCQPSSATYYLSLLGQGMSNSSQI